MRPTPRVSVLINNYNYGCFLREAIDSALSQETAEVQVVVVDDGSTDESADVIHSFGNAIVGIFQRNAGQAAAFNTGFEACDGDFVMLLDADDRFLPGKARAVVSAYESDPRLTWCFHQLRLFGNPAVRSQRQLTGDAVIDAREMMRRGKLTAPASATSGLTFSRSLLSRLLPMPVDIRITSDNYLKFAAMASGPGIFLAASLAEQRLHQSNAYTMRRDVAALRGTIAVRTALHLAHRFPEVRRFASGHLSHGFANLMRARALDPATRRMIVAYLRALPTDERLSLAGRLAYRGVTGYASRWLS